MELPLDRYAIRARVAPGLIAILPVFFGVTAWSAAGLSWPESALWSVVLGLLSLLGAQFIRDAGYRREPSLFARWNGAPTTRLLRHSDSTLDPNTKQRYHVRLAALLPGVALPTAQDESGDPVRADGVYKSCGDHLRERTRDKEKFGHLHESNIDYGFRRNLWAIKPAGLVLAAAGTLVTGVRGHTGCSHTEAGAWHPCPCFVARQTACSRCGGGLGSRRAGWLRPRTPTRDTSSLPVRYCSRRWPRRIRQGSSAHSLPVVRRWGSSNRPGGACCSRYLG